MDDDRIRGESNGKISIEVEKGKGEQLNMVSHIQEQCGCHSGKQWADIKVSDKLSMEEVREGVVGDMDLDVVVETTTKEYPTGADVPRADMDTTKQEIFPLQHPTGQLLVTEKGSSKAGKKGTYRRRGEAKKAKQGDRKARVSGSDRKRHNLDEIDMDNLSLKKPRWKRSFVEDFDWEGNELEMEFSVEKVGLLGQSRLAK